MHTTNYVLRKPFSIYLWPMKQSPKLLPSKAQFALFQALCTGTSHSLICGFSHTVLIGKAFLPLPAWTPC